MESLGNGSTRSLETNLENTSPRLQLANHDAPGGRGVQREPAYESAAISTPTSKATTSAVAERNRLFNFGFRCSSAKRSKSASSVPKTKKRLSTCSHDFVCLWSTTTMNPMEGDSSGRVDPLPKLSTARKRRLLAVLTRSSKPDILFLLHARTVCTFLA